MKRQAVFAVVVTVVMALTCASAPALADTQALDFTRWNELSIFEKMTFGWDFTVAQPVQVTQLGTWAFWTTGLRGPQTVTIWGPGDEELVSATVSSNGAYRGWHWQMLGLADQVILTPGATYTIGAYTADDAGVYRALDLTVSPEIMYEGGRQHSSGYGRPDALPWFPEASVFGPNFQFDPVPEPAAVQLPLLLGLAGAGAWWRLRRHSSRPN